MTAHRTNFLSSGLVTNPKLAFLNQGRTAKAYNMQDNATFTAGNHKIRFGAQFQAIRINAFNFAGTAPTYTLGVGTATPQISTAQFTQYDSVPRNCSNQPTRFGANALWLFWEVSFQAQSQTLNATTQTKGMRTEQAMPADLKMKTTVFMFPISGASVKI